MKTLAHRNRESGFSLVELQVVLAILAILATILFSVVSHATFSAGVSEDIAHLRQIGVARELYLSDYGDYPNAPFLDQLVAGRYVPTEILESRLDPLPEGYANQERRNSMGDKPLPPTPYKLSYVSFYDQYPYDKFRNDPPIEQNTGWLIALHVNLPVRDQFDKYRGRYARLVYDGSVVTGKVRWEYYRKNGTYIECPRPAEAFGLPLRPCQPY